MCTCFVAGGGREEGRDTKGAVGCVTRAAQGWFAFQHHSKTGLLYGNLCCAKILIYREEHDALTIRLGDPSVALFCDTLPITDTLNQRRCVFLGGDVCVCVWGGGMKGGGVLVKGCLCVVKKLVFVVKQDQNRNFKRTLICQTCPLMM